MFFLTEEEFRNFKKEILLEIQKILAKKEQPFPEMLTSKEVCKLLRKCPGTLRTMRKKGLISSIKVGRGMLYNGQEILDVLKGKKSGGATGCVVYWFTALYPLLQLDWE